MAKKEKKAPSMHVLSKLIPSARIVDSAGTVSVGGVGWQSIDTNNSTQKLLRWRGYFDLSGYTQQDLTFFIQSLRVSENQGIVTATDTPISCMDVISKNVINDGDLNHTLDITTQLYSPGFMDSLQDMDEILYCRHRSFYQTNTQLVAGDQQLLHLNQWGEGNATAGDKIYITRYFTAIPRDTTLAIPQACVQIIGATVKEGELEYLMRLKRSYEIAGPFS
jgi:hypothetical protein